MNNTNYKQKDIQYDDQNMIALDNMPLYISKLNLDLNIVWANKHAIEFGQDLVDSKCYHGFNPDLEQCTFCPIVRAITSKNTEISLVEISGEEGENDKVFEITAIPIFGDQNELDGVYEVRRDVSLQLDQKNSKSENKQSSKKNREELFTSDHLLDIVSNELREHADNAVKMHTRMNSRKLTHDQKMGLAGMRTSLTKIQNVLNNITTMRNINKGILKQSKKKADLKQLVTKKFSYYQSKTDFNGNSFDYKYDSTIPTKLILDKTKMDLILSNLIDYSMTHTSNRYINLMTTLLDDDGDNVKIGFKIKNVGSIIIHDLVYKDHENYIKNNLTLTVIRHLVIKQSGTMRMIPSNGYGIDIELTLSFKRPFTAAKLPFFNRVAEDLRVKKEKSAVGESSGKKKILIAEDEPIGRITIEQMLKKDYDIILAKNGKVAVEKYFEENPDLVIMDIMMPIMNGFDAFDQIERNCIKRVPIIACTAKVINSEKEYLKSYGFDDYIAKPVSVKTLRDVIKRHIT